MGKKEPTEKEKYEVWWRAITLNEEYGKWLRDDLPIYLENPSQYAQDDYSPEGMSKAQCINCFHFFGNVHETTFDQWWENKALFKENNPPVTDYAQWAGLDIKRQWAEMLNRENEYTRFLGAPTKDNAELGNTFAERYQQHLRTIGLLFLCVDVTADLDELTKQFREHVIRQREKSQYVLQPYRWGRVPTADRFMLNKIRGYLTLYEKWNQSTKKHWDKFLKNCLPDKYNATENIKSRQRQFERYLQYSKNLIQNAVRGTFPGDYTSPPRIDK